jgi:hypothetical protein
MGKKKKQQKKQRKQFWMDVMAVAAFLIEAAEFGMEVSDRWKKAKKPA